MIAAYQIKEDINRLLTKGRLFTWVGNQIVLLATPTEPQMFYSSYSFQKLDGSGQLRQVNLEDEKWVHPHLYKPIKLQILGHP